MAGGGSKNQTSTQTTEPPAYIRPYLQDAATQSQNLYRQGPQEYYGGPTVVGFSPESEQAMTGITNRATNGSAVNQAATNLATQTLSGTPTSQFGSGANPWSTPQVDYAGVQNPYVQGANYGAQQNPWATQENPYGGASNPYLDATFNRAADSVQNRLQSAFAGSGRNIDAARPVAAQEMNDLATNIYGGDYTNERNRQLQYQQQLTGIGAEGYENAQNRDLQMRGLGSQAFENAQGRDLSYRGQLTGIGAQGYEAERDRMATDINQQRQQQLATLGLAPSIANQDYTDFDRLAQVGATREDLTGRQYEDAAARWDFGQNAPGLALDQYIARLQGGMSGSSTSSTTPVYRNQAAGILGGAQAGMGIGNQFGYGGWGAAIGGLLGALG